MKKLLFVVLVLVSASAFAQNDEVTIRKMLQAQVDQWNKGNIEGYMYGYWESDSLLFIGKSGPKYGYEQTLANYRKSYPDAAAMGKLNSEVISLKKLSPEYYFAVGKWELEREAGNLAGSWTLLIRKIKGKWVIVSDHSS